MRNVFKARPWRGRVMVLAGAAVLFAAGGGAYAAGAASRGSNPNGPTTGPTSGPFATAKGAPFIAGAAVVNSDGTIARAIGVKSATEVGTGEYQVLFKHNVNRCGYTATLGNSGTGFPPDGQISVALRSSHKNGVYIATFNSAGTSTSAGFHLAVIC